jgi:hypothetical protein
MAPDQELQPGEPARTGERAPHRWPVWRLPSPLLGAVLLVETIAAALLVVDLLARPEPTSA